MSSSKCSFKNTISFHRNLRSVGKFQWNGKGAGIEEARIMGDRGGGMVLGLCILSSAFLYRPNCPVKFTQGGPKRGRNARKFQQVVESFNATTHRQLSNLSVFACMSCYRR